MATDDTRAARLLNPTAEDVAYERRLAAAREGVVKALEAMMAALNKRNEGIPIRSFAEAHAYDAAHAALKELEEASK